MKLLAFESSAGPASVCLVQDGKVLVSMSRNDGLTHSQTLLDMAGTVLDSAHLTLPTSISSPFRQVLALSRDFA